MSLFSWNIEETGFSSDKITEYGNKFLTGNGYMGVRGTLEEYKKEHLVAINLAGIYDQVENSWREPLNAPNGLYTTLIIDEENYALPLIDPYYHLFSLDLRKALLRRKTIWKKPRGKVHVESERFVSLAHPHLIGMKYCIFADFHADIELITGIDADVWDINGPHYKEMALTIENQILTATGTTREKQYQVCVAENCTVDFISEKKVTTHGGQILRHFSFITDPGKKYEMIKWISVYTSRDAKDCQKKAVHLVSSYSQKAYHEAREEHIRKWEEKWAGSEVLIEGQEEAMRALNYSIYHLHCIAPRHSGSLSIAARGLSGQTYKGAVFWDTEMFILDFFLYTEPHVARTLLKYRIDTLEGALKKAKSYGYDGAFYAWESQEGGLDACSDYNVTDVFTGRPMRTHFKDKQVHISSAVVYGIMKYIDITGDHTVLFEGGARVILECAKFYYSLLLKRIDKVCYEIHDVIGPDEYHERVNNNGYTNRMAKFTFDAALSIIELIEEAGSPVSTDILKEYPVKEFKEKFLDGSTRLHIPSPDEEGIIEQFDGYNQLEDTYPHVLRSRLLHEKEYWGGAYGVASHTKVIKQADVVTWLSLFPNEFSEEILLKNWNYYEPRTEHGSSLSACMYALLACRCGLPDVAYPFFLKSAEADLRGGGKEWAGLIYIGGTHPAAAGGAYMTAINGFGGLYFENGQIKAKPQLPAKWQRLRFKVWYLGKLYEIDATKEGAGITQLSPDS